MEGKIYQSIINIMNDTEAISKARTNPQQGYKFRGIDDIYNALHSIFAKHGVFITSEVLSESREERTTQKGGLLLYSILTVRFLFFASDGSSVACVTKGEAMDSGDKATNKAMSAALKYALMQMLLIPTEEEKDNEAQTPQPAAKKPEPKPAPQKEPPMSKQAEVKSPFVGMTKELAAKFKDGWNKDEVLKLATEYKSDWKKIEDTCNFFRWDKAAILDATKSQEAV